MTTTTTGLQPLLRQQLVDTCDLLAYSPDIHAALLREFDSETSPAGRRVLLAYYPFSLNDHDWFVRSIDRVAQAARDTATSYRADHDGLCSHALGCDSCEQHWQQLLDDAVRDLEVALGEQAMTDLRGAA